MKESQLEQYLKREVDKLGGLSFKWVSPSLRGVPDRIVILPNGSVEFVELKTETGRLSKLQEYIISQLRNHNCNVHVLYGKGDIDEFLKYCIKK